MTVDSDSNCLLPQDADEHFLGAGVPVPTAAVCSWGAGSRIGPCVGGCVVGNSSCTTSGVVNGGVTMAEGSASGVVIVSTGEGSCTGAGSIGGCAAVVTVPGPVMEKTDRETGNTRSSGMKHMSPLQPCSMSFKLPENVVSGWAFSGTDTLS